MNLKKGTVKKAFNWQQVENSPTVNVERKIDGKQANLVWSPPMRGGIDRRFEAGDIIKIDKVAADKPNFDRFLLLSYDIGYDIVRFGVGGSPSQKSSYVKWR